MRKLRLKIESDNFRAAAIWVIVVMIFLGCSRCKEKPTASEEILKHRVDSVLILFSIHDKQIEEIKKRKPIHDTIIIINHRKVDNESKQIDRFNNISRKRWADSVKIANNIK